MQLQTRPILGCWEPWNLLAGSYRYMLWLYPGSMTPKHYEDARNPGAEGPSQGWNPEQHYSMIRQMVSTWPLFDTQPATLPSCRELWKIHASSVGLSPRVDQYLAPLASFPPRRIANKRTDLGCRQVMLNYFAFHTSSGLLKFCIPCPGTP